MALDIPNKLGSKGFLLKSRNGNTADIDPQGNLNVSGSVVFNGTQNVQFPAAQSVQFDSAQNVNATIAGTPDVNISSTTGNIDVDIQNATLDVSGSVTFPSAQDVTIQNALLAVSGSVTFPAAQSVEFATAQDVNVLGTSYFTLSGSNAVNISGIADVDIQNASVDVFTTSNNTEQHKIIAGSTTTAQSWTNSIKSFLFYNDGPYDVHVSMSGSATTNMLKIVNGASFTIDVASQDTQFIGSTSGSTVYAIGVY